jgi:hypothetical protein
MSLTTNNQSPAPFRGDDRSEIWRRGLIMLIFLFCFSFGEGLLVLIAVAQFIWLAKDGRRNEFLAAFGGSLACWLADAARFLTGASENKPFPWAPWPHA